MAELIEMPFGLWAWMGPRNHVLDGVHIPHWKGQFWRKGAPIVKYRDFLPWAVQKRLNRSIWHLGCGLGWKYQFNRIRQVATIFPYGEAYWPHLPNTTEPSICGGDVALCQITFGVYPITEQQKQQLHGHYSGQLVLSCTLHHQLRTARFCCSKVLPPACPCWWQLAHSY